MVKIRKGGYVKMIQVHGISLSRTKYHYLFFHQTTTTINLSIMLMHNSFL